MAFAAVTSLDFLHTGLTKPLHGEQVNLRDTYAVTATDRDVALLRRWLPTEGKVGYLSSRPQFPRFQIRLWLSPLLLDDDWRKHDLLLLDLPSPRQLATVESSGYRLLTALPEANSFAMGMRVYRRSP